MGHNRKNCPENQRNKRRDRDQANISNEETPKQNKDEESETK